MPVVDITASIMPLFHVSRLLGLVCLTPSREKTRTRLVASRLGAAWTAIVIASYITLLVVISVYISENIGHSLVISQLSLAGSIVGSIAPLVLALVYLCGAMRQRRFVDLLDVLHNVDGTMSRHGIHVPHSRNRRFIIALIGGGLTLLFLLIIADLVLMYAVKENERHLEYVNAFWLLTVYAPRITTSITEWQILIAVLGVRQRLRLLNGHLGRRDVADVPTVRSVAGLHAALCDAGNLVNDVYSCQLLGGLITHFCDVMFTIYWGTMNIVLPEQARFTHCGVYVTLWLIWFVINMVVLCACCGLATRETKMTANHVHRMLRRSKQPLVQQELMKLSNQLLHHRFTITACDFFTVDLSLICSMVGALTTYLILLVQFEVAAQQAAAHGNNTSAFYG